MSKQEPVAWWSGEPDTYILSDAEYQRHKANENFDGIRRLKPLYTAPPKRQPLSDEEIRRLRLTDFINVDCGSSAAFKLVRLTEKAHGIGVDNDPT